MAALRKCLVDLRLEEVIDHGPQILSFQIHSCVCPKATPPMGCSWPKTECFRNTQIPGRHQTSLLVDFAWRTLRRLLLHLSQMQDSLVAFCPLIFLALSFSHSLGTLLTFSDSLPISFHMSIFSNKILAHLILFWSLLLKGPRPREAY